MRWRFLTNIEGDLKIISDKGVKKLFSVHLTASA